MKKSRFTDGQIMAVLKRSDGGEGVPDLCREIGISTATFDLSPAFSSSFG